VFDIALEEAHDVPARAPSVDGLSSPLLVLAVEDEVTGTGSLVHRLIFGVTERDGKIEVLRDRELLQLTNGLTVKNRFGAGSPTEGAETVIERLKQAFDVDLAPHASTLRRPVSWLEMLFFPDAAG
jgi:hypothetical protein